MTTRVIPFAQKSGYGYYHGTPGLLRWLPRGAQVAINQAWLLGKVLTRHAIKEVGEPRVLPLLPSAFYNAEQRLLERLRFPRYERIDLGD